MNLKNLEYIKSGLRELGFGDKLYPDLEAGLSKNQPRFHIVSKTKINDQEIISAIHLEKSSQSDKYKITKYDALIKKEPDLYDNKIHSFYINKNKGVTLKEAFNMLEGRAVLKPTLKKDGTVENTWMQLDLKKEDRVGNLVVNKYGDNHGFNLQKSLEELFILDMKRTASRETLIRSLQKGNREQVTIERGGVKEKMFIEANPKAGIVNTYDAKMQKVEKESLLESQTMSQSDIHQKIAQLDRKAPAILKELTERDLSGTKSKRNGLSH